MGNLLAACPFFRADARSEGGMGMVFFGSSHTGSAVSSLAKADEISGPRRQTSLLLKPKPNFVH